MIAAQFALISSLVHIYVLITNVINTYVLVKNIFFIYIINMACLNKVIPLALSFHFIVI